MVLHGVSPLLVADCVAVPLRVLDRDAVNTAAEAVAHRHHPNIWPVEHEQMNRFQLFDVNSELLTSGAGRMHAAPEQALLTRRCCDPSG